MRQIVRNDVQLAYPLRQITDAIFIQMRFAIDDEEGEAVIFLRGLDARVDSYLCHHPTSIDRIEGDGFFEVVILMQRFLDAANSFQSLSESRSSLSPLVILPSTEVSKKRVVSEREVSGMMCSEQFLGEL